MLRFLRRLRKRLLRNNTQLLRHKNGNFRRRTIYDDILVKERLSYEGKTTINE